MQQFSFSLQVPLANADIAVVSKLAKERGVTLEDLARNVFLVGLKRFLPPKVVRPNQETLAKTVDWREFERMVKHNGYSIAEFIKKKQLGCTREALRQAATERGFWSPMYERVSRSSEWLLKRRARRLHNMNLANHDWLENRMIESRTLLELAADLKISESNLSFFMKLHGLHHTRTAQTVDRTVSRRRLPASVSTPAVGQMHM